MLSINLQCSNYNFRCIDANDYKSIRFEVCECFVLLVEVVAMAGGLSVSVKLGVREH